MGGALRGDSSVWCEGEGAGEGTLSSLSSSTSWLYSKDPGSVTSVSSGVGEVGVWGPGEDCTRRYVSGPVSSFSDETDGLRSGISDTETENETLEKISYV